MNQSWPSLRPVRTASPHPLIHLPRPRFDFSILLKCIEEVERNVSVLTFGGEPSVLDDPHPIFLLESFKPTVPKFHESFYPHVPLLLLI